MRLGVVGSRKWTDYALMCQVLDEIAPTVIVSGGARGADRLAERYASERGLSLRVFKPNLIDHRKFRDAAFARNAEIVADSDQVVAFWIGNSTGTAHTIGLAKKAGKLLRIVEGTPSLFSDQGVMGRQG
jgi:predicted Rossmann fold nucleotide-binding protein DprA/Smf involved in DNA uptake